MMKDRELTREVREYAMEAHGDQRYGDRPYVAHLDAVAALTSLVTSEDRLRLMTVAYLHDVLEDTPVTREELRERWGSSVAEAVALITDPDAQTRKERKKLLHERLAQTDERTEAGRMALLVKVADRLANVWECVATKQDGLLKMYRKEHADFRRAAYRPGMCDSWWEEIERRLG